MEKFVQVVEQIHEAGRFLNLKSVPHARIALLLLDNVAEILMYRSVMNKLQYDEMWTRLFESAKATMPPDKVESFIEESGYVQIPVKQRKAMLSQFIPKVDFLTEQMELPEIMGEVIIALHRYRNDAYHRDKVRSATLHAAGVIYYEVACELLVIMQPSSMVFSSTDDWSVFRRKYGVESNYSILPDGIKNIASKLRSAIVTDTTSFAEVLSTHLISRLDELNEQLDYICENDVERGNDHPSELKRIQYWKETGRLPRDKAEQQFASFMPKYIHSHLAEWRTKADDLRTHVGEENLKLLREFCEVERTLEPLEEMINEVASIIDQAIQFEIDRVRGK